MQPFASVVVGLPCTDGFELTLRWNDRWANGDGAPRSAFATQLDEASRPKIPTPETARVPEKQTQPAAPKRPATQNPQGTQPSP